MTKFINPSSVVAEMGLRKGQTVADLGCGSGFYVLPAAQLVGDSGQVYAVDIQESKLAATMSAARQYGLKNVQILKADLDQPALELPEGSCDAVIMASILHEISSRDMLLKNAYRILKTGGKVLAVEWKKEITPIGPAMEVRISKDELEKLLNSKGLYKDKDIHADSYHYAMVFVK